MTDYEAMQALQQRQRLEAQLADLLDRLVEIVPAVTTSDFHAAVRDRMNHPHMLDEVARFANAVRMSAPPPVSLNARRGSPDAWTKP